MSIAWRVQSVRLECRPEQTQFSIEAEAVPGTIPIAVAPALSEAAAEAVRNALRHTTADADRRFRARIAPTRITIRISNDGPGFDFSALPHDRLGIRECILGRVRELGGASAEIRSGADAGTEVMLRWEA